jgi:hypothetical protein
MGVSGQRHAPAALYPWGKIFLLVMRMRMSESAAPEVQHIFNEIYEGQEM